METIHTSLMNVVANHGSGDDIRNLASLIKTANPNAVVAHQPLMRVRHVDGNIYEGLGFIPSKTFMNLGKLSDELSQKVETVRHSNMIEETLKNQELTEECAALFILLTNSLPLPMIAMALGAK